MLYRLPNRNPARNTLAQDSTMAGAESQLIKHQDNDQIRQSQLHPGDAKIKRNQRFHVTLRSGQRQIDAKIGRMIFLHAEYPPSVLLLSF